MRFPLSTKARASLQLAASAKQARESHARDLTESNVTAGRPPSFTSFPPRPRTPRDSDSPASALRTVLDGMQGRAGLRDSRFVTPNHMQGAMAAASNLHQHHTNDPGPWQGERLAQLSRASRQVHTLILYTFARRGHLSTSRSPVNHWRQDPPQTGNHVSCFSVCNRLAEQ